MKNRDERTNVDKILTGSQLLVLREAFFSVEVATLLYTADPYDLGHNGPAN